MESTIIRTLDTTVMIVGPGGPVADKIAAHFERARIRVVRVGHAAAGGERLAVAMPQLVLVIGDLHAEERDALADRATAVGALVMHVDPELDDDSREELLERAVEVAVERRILRERNDPAAEAVDSGWE